MRSKVLKVVCLSFLLTCMFALPVFASDSVFTIDKAGNTFIVDNDCNISEDIDNELYAAGNSIKAHDMAVDGSVFVAGSRIEIENVDINGSLYAAGEEIEIDAKVNNNINVAGEKITISDASEAKAIRAAGEKVTIKGTCKNIVVFADTVNLDGVIDGDIAVTCATLNIADSAQITGKLSVEAPSEPEIPDSVAIGNVEYKKSEDSSDKDKAKIVGGAAGVILGMILKKILKIIYWCIAYSIIGIIIYLLFNKDMINANAMLYERTVPLIASGVLGIVTVPMAVILMFIFFILAPVGGITLLLYILILCLSKILVFTTVVREYVFTKLIKSEKKRNPYIEIMLMALLCVVLTSIPFIKGIVGFACNAIALGYFIQKGYLTLSSNSAKTVDNVNEQTTSEETAQ